MAVHLIGGIVVLVILFGAIISVVGYLVITNAYRNEYSMTTYHMADTATTLVNGDNIDAYLAGEKKAEYRWTKAALDVYCKNMRVSLVYVIKVDTSDYQSFVSVFNSVDNSVDNSSYVPWELGHQREATNEEYSQKYKAIYEEGVPYETVYRFDTTGPVHPHVTTMVPVYNGTGEVVSILCIQRPIRELREAIFPCLFAIIGTIILLSILASVFATTYYKKQFVIPIRKTSEEAARFAKENTKGEPLGQISRYREISSLAQSIDTMETSIVQYVEDLTAVTAVKERMSAELSVARNIQADSIPRVFPAFPDRSDFDIYASMTPAREVGGDFYNFILIDDDHLAVLIGDVSGKGVPAALYMMVTNILTSDRAKVGGAPSQILSYVNNDLCGQKNSEMFVTVWLGILELSTGRMIAANAGHEYPAVMKNGTFALLKDKHGFVLGGLEDVPYKDYELSLEPGDKLFLYTDGVPEATNSDVQMFGTERMLQALNKDPKASPQQILENVRAGVKDFVKDAEPFDDLTMLCLEYKGKISYNKVDL